MRGWFRSGAVVWLVALGSLVASACSDDEGPGSGDAGAGGSAARSGSAGSGARAGAGRGGSELGGDAGTENGGADSAGSDGLAGAGAGSDTGGADSGGSSGGGMGGMGGSAVTAIAVSASGFRTCALLSTHAVRCWGEGGLGANGYGDSNTVGDDETPGSKGDIAVGGSVLQVATGSGHTCALLEGGTVRCWGQGRYGKLGYGNTNDIGDNELPSSAGDVSIGGKVIQVTAGRDHTCALLEGGTARCWGANEHGQLGYGNTTNIGDNELPSSTSAVDVGGTVSSLAAGENSTCARLTTGKVRCWGQASYGVLGYGNTNDIGDNELPSSAGDVNIGGNVAQLSVGWNHACAVLDTGKVRCWGVGSSGALGYGNTARIGDDETPASAGDVNVGALAAEVAAGTFLTCARLSNGNVRCWGDAQHAGGGLGYANKLVIGDDEAPAVAGDVNVGASVTQLTAGYDHVCALTTTGGVRCWGNGSVGRLGYGNVSTIGDDEVPAAAGDVPLFSATSNPGTGGTGGTGGASGGSAGTGGSAVCTGTAVPCSQVSDTQCTPAPQCFFPVTPCTNKPVGPAFCSQLSQQACTATTGCVWTGGASPCSLSPSYCPSFSTQTACLSTPPAAVCNWSSPCLGTADCSLITNAEWCGLQPGCSWH